MGWFSSFISDPIGTLGDTGQKVIDTVTENPVETAALAAAVYFGMPPATAETGATAFGISEGAVTATDLGYLGTETASTAGLSGIDLGGAGGSPASWLNSTGSASTGWTAGQVASTATSGLNLATSATKLSMLGKTMNASTPTVDGLTGGLAASPIQTPSGLITTTPQGPLVAGPVAASGGFMGMDNQTLIVIAVSVAGIYYLMKHGK
jgi:hypothetical protein